MHDSGNLSCADSGVFPHYGENVLLCFVRLKFISDAISDVISDQAFVAPKLFPLNGLVFDGFHYWVIAVRVVDEDGLSS